MGDNRLYYLFDERRQCIAAGLKQLRAKRFEGLQRRFEANRAWIHIVGHGGLSHHSSNQVVGQQMHPDFFSHDIGGLAPQDVHLHHALERPQIELRMPTGSIQVGQLARRKSSSVQKRGRYSDFSRAKAASRHLQPQQADGRIVHRLGVADDTVAIESTASTTAQTGVEMEALTAVSVAALTLYDMAKAIDKAMVIDDVHLVEKSKEPA